MRIFRLSILLFGLLALPAAAGDRGGSYALGVDGLGCPFCVYGIEKELAAIDGVESLDADIDEGVITVHVRPGVTLSEGEARRATEDAGFSLRSFEQVSAE